MMHKLTLWICFLQMTGKWIAERVLDVQHVGRCRWIIKIYQFIMLIRFTAPINVLSSCEVGVNEKYLRCFIGVENVERRGCKQIISLAWFWVNLKFELYDDLLQLLLLSVHCTYTKRNLF